MSDNADPDERPVATVYPSVASTAFGRVLGMLYDSIGVRIGRLKLSHLLFPLPTAPLAIVVYAWLKIAGRRYVLTTHRLRVVKGLVLRPGEELPIDEVGRVEIVTLRGQRFYNAGDLVVHDHLGSRTLTLAGVVRPEMFRRTILDTRDALINTDAALRVIESRRSSGAA